MNQDDVWKCLFRLKINLNIRYKNCKILKGEYQSDTYSFHLKSVSCSVHSIFDVSRLPSSIPFPPVVILFSSLKQEWYICWIIERTKCNKNVEKYHYSDLACDIILPFWFLFWFVWIHFIVAWYIICFRRALSGIFCK